MVLPRLQEETKVGRCNQRSCGKAGWWCGEVMGNMTGVSKLVLQ